VRVAGKNLVALKKSCEVIEMTALRSEAINLLENVPEKYLLEIVQYVKNFLAEKEITSEGALQAFYKLRSEAEKNNSCVQCRNFDSR